MIRTIAMSLIIVVVLTLPLVIQAEARMGIGAPVRIQTKDATAIAPASVTQPSMKTTVVTIPKSEVKLSEAEKELVNLRQKIDPDVHSLSDPFQGHYKSIYGKLTFPQAGDKRTIVEQFLNKHIGLFKLSDFSSNFLFVKVEESKRNGPTYFFYQQHINNVPILGSGVSVAIDTNGVIRSIDSKHRSDLPLNFATTPRYSQDQVRNTLKSGFPNLTNWKDHGLFVYRNYEDKLWYLIWKFTARKNMEKWVFFIDASTLLIVDKFSTAREQNCTLEMEKWGSDDLPVCLDAENDQYLLYSAPDQSPTTFEVHDMLTGDYIKTYPKTSWPPESYPALYPGESHKHDLKVQANTQKVLLFLKNALDQESWGQCNDKPCPLYLHTNDESIKARYATWWGDGDISFGTSCDENVDLVCHEITHGLVDFYYGGDFKPYCDDPVSSGIEEGFADTIGLVAIFYDWNWSKLKGLEMIEQQEGLLGKNPKLSIESFKEYLNSDDHDCGAHEFGGFVTSFACMLVVGLRTPDPKETDAQMSLGLDVANLFSFNDIGQLFVEMLRYKKNWRNNEYDFATAIMSTCMDRVGSLFTLEQCKNVERVLKLMHIPPDVGYGVQPITVPYYQPLYVDLDLKPPMIDFVEEKGEDIVYQRMKGSLVLKEGDFPISGAHAQINDTIIPLNFKNTGDSLTWFAGQYVFDLGKIEDYFPITKSFILTFPLEGSNYNGTNLHAYGYGGYVDTNSSNNMVQLNMGVNLVPKITVTLASNDPIGGSDPFLCAPSGSFLSKFKFLGFKPWEPKQTFPYDECIYKWNIIIFASNVGNRPTYPLIVGTLLGPNPSGEQIDTALSQYTSKISGTQEQFLSDSLWGDYIEQWKMGLDRQPESCYGGYYPEPRIVPAGTYFCVTKYNEVAAKPGDEFIAYVDYDNDIPELNEMDNRVAFTVYPKASKPCGSLLMCLWEQNKRAMIREVSKMKDQFKQVNEYMVMGLHGPEPISNSFLFGPGERVVMPPDASGHYSSDAFADPYIENKATSTDPTLH